MLRRGKQESSFCCVVFVLSACRIVDEMGKDVVDGTKRGELLIKTPALMSGYLNNPVASNSTVIDGWLHTGDVASLEDGLWYIVDRRKVCSCAHPVFPSCILLTS